MNLPRSILKSMSCMKREKNRSRSRPTLPVSNGRWNAATNSSSRWIAIFRTTRTKFVNFLKAAKNADLVPGSRYVGGIRVMNWPLKRLMLSRFAGKYVALVTGMPFTDPTGGYKCFRRRALQAINLDKIRSNGYGFQIELTNKLWRHGMQSRRSADHLHRPHAGTIQNGRWHRQRSVLDGLAALAAKWFAPLTAQAQLKICQTRRLI